MASTTSDGGARPRIGFIGVGTMGKSMARNLLKAHYQVTAYDLNPAPLDELREFGADVATSAAACAAAGDVVITMVQGPADVEAAALGSSGVLDGIRQDAIYVDMSTIDPTVTKKVHAVFRDRGVQMLDAPVSGGSNGARDGTLTIMVGGPAELFERLEPVFGAMGTNIIHCGDVGMGGVVKLVNNLMSAVNTAAIVEAFNLGVHAGADPRVMFDVVSKSSGSCFGLLKNTPIPGLNPDTPSSRGDEPGFMIDLMVKDLSQAMAAAQGAGAPAMLANVAHEMYRAASNMGYGRKHTSAIRYLYEALSRAPG
ncbi:MAG: 3-hydroxyisobutyrate dehydrogenase [Chloroflexota bacterium]